MRTRTSAPVAAALLALVAGCGSDPMMPADLTPHLDVTGEYTLQPGEEKYLCYTARLPAGQSVAITRLVPGYGPATHHILLSQTLVDEPEGASVCSVLSKDTWLPLYAGGLESGTLAMPSGTAMPLLARGQQVVMQLHLQNATSQPVAARTTMRIEYQDTSQMHVSAGLFGFDNRVIDIPAHTTGVVHTMSCVPGVELDVFAYMGHMHKHGRHIQLSRGANAGDEVLFDSEWSFDLQPITPKTFHIAATDRVFLRCTHDNDGDTAIQWGESSDTEMCATVLYAAPAKIVNGCINQ